MAAGYHISSYRDNDPECLLPATYPRTSYLSSLEEVAYYNAFLTVIFEVLAENGTTAHDQVGCPADPTKCTGRTNLVGLGSGVFALGAPRSLEFGFRVIF